MVRNMLEPAFVPMENISSCALCLCSIGLLGIWSVNPLKLHHRYKTQRISVIIANAFIDMCLRESHKMNDWLSFFMMNPTTSYMEA